MKILLTGGTGFIGSQLVKELVLSGHELIILSRNKHENKNSITFIPWESEILKQAVNSVDVVINLAGESIVKRWTEEQKELVYKSRIETTGLIVRAINSSTKKPKKLINASAIGFYGNRNDEILTEDSNVGSGFLANTCRDWENEAKKANTEVVLLRVGLVLGKEGGALKKMLLPFKMGIGGPLGSGNQYMSWISLHDMVSLIKFAAENEKVAGILNATSPNPVTNKEFSNILGKVFNRPAFMPVPDIALKMLFGEMASLLLEGQRVMPKRALEYGFQFKYPALEDTLRV